MYKALYLSPMIPSFHVATTTAFFKEILGFEASTESPGYSIMVKDNLTLHFLPAGKDIGQMEFYLEVDSIDKLWEAIKEKVHGLKVKGPFDREYGMREIHLEIPQTNCLLFIGQVIAIK